MNKRINQIKYLIIQELRQASRSRYIVITFVLLPILMWGFYGGIQYFAISSIQNSTSTNEFQGKNIFVINQDVGNSSINMGQILINNLQLKIQNQNSSLFDTRVTTKNVTITNFQDIYEYVFNKGISPLIFIPSNFTELYTNFNENQTKIPLLNIFYKTEDNKFASALTQVILSITQNTPFTQKTTEKSSKYNITILTYQGEEDASNLYLLGFLGYVIILLTVMAPIPYLSMSFAGEREKGTLESLISLPMRRFDILSGKLLAGMGLLMIFVVSNIIGVEIFAYIMNQIAKTSDNPNLSGFTITPNIIFSIILMVLLTSLVSVGIGICIASLMKDSRTAESVFMIIMIIPAVIVGLNYLVNGIPTWPSLMYLIPWTHSLAILNKSMFPKTYSSSTITGSIFGDIILHIGYLLVFVVVSLLIGSKLFSREQMVN